MADQISDFALLTLLEQLPREREMPEEITKRVRFVTADGRTVFAFLRAGRGPLAFSGWEATADAVEELEMAYFILGAEKPGDPLQIIGKDGPLGVVTQAVLEDRPPEDAPPDDAPPEDRPPE